jgi:hypothetical protein
MMGEKKKYSIFLIATIVVVSCSVLFKPMSAFATEAEGNVSPMPVNPEFKPRLGIYYYKADFNNMNIGTACIAIDRDGDLYKVQVLAQTTGTVDRIYKLRYRGEALMETDPLSPVESTMQQQVRSTEKDTTIHFKDDGTIKTVEKKTENGNTVKYDVRTLQTERFTLDPFSATYLVRGLDWKVGTEKVFDVYPGKHQYELRLRCDSMAIIDIGGEKRSAFVIIPKLTNLDPEKQAEALKKKPASMKIYVSADEFKDVLEIDATHTLGNFRVVLVRFEPPVNQSKEEDAQSRKEDAQSKGDIQNEVKAADEPNKKVEAPSKPPQNN